MKSKRYIAYFLIFISMVMLVVPVIPHHHHDNGLICMKNDITPDCCAQHHSTPDKEHCCCDTGCVTTHFFQQTPSSDNGLANPDFPLIITLFSEPLLRLLLTPIENGQRQECVYRESLHGTYLTRATGLRAPPSVLS